MRRRDFIRSAAAAIAGPVLGAQPLLGEPRPGPMVSMGWMRAWVGGTVVRHHSLLEELIRRQIEADHPGARVIDLVEVGPGQWEADVEWPRPIEITFTTHLIAEEAADA